MFDSLIFAGFCICIGLFVGFCIRLIRLYASKRKSILVEGIASSCTLDKKFLYTAVDVKYTYTVDGIVYRNTANVKGVYHPNIHNSQDIRIYVDTAEHSKSFPEEEIKTLIKSCLILLVLILLIAASYIFG